MDILLLHNPKAGDNGIDADGLRRLLRGAGHAVDYRESEPRDVRRWLRADAELIAVAGGDGTVADVLRVMPPDAPPVAILPLGTANNLARALGVRGSLEAIVAGLAGGRTIPIDVGIAEGPWGREPFFESVGLGVIAHALGPVNRQRVPSTQKIPLGIAAMLASLEAMQAGPVRLTVDGAADEAGLLMLEVMTLPSIGPQLRFAPAAHPGDGCFHVVTATARDRTALARWIADPDRRAAAPVQVRTARRVEVRWQGLESHVDDAFHPARAVGADLTITLDPGAVRIRVPR